MNNRNSRRAHRADTPPIGTKSRADLLAVAQRLWPDDRALQAIWLRAVRIVRRTSRGWLLERRVDRLQQGAA